MKEFFEKLFSSDYMPHGYCYLWKSDVMWLHAVSDGLIMFSYYVIPVLLIYFVRKRRDLPFHWMFVMFGAFIFGCGTTHLMEIWTLWHGTYRLAGVVKAVTAGASLITAAALFPMIPKALALPSPRALRLEIEQRKQAEDALLQREQDLIEAQRVAQVGSWRWDQNNEVVSWSKELYRIAGRDPKLSPPTFGEQTELYTPESWGRLKTAVEEALRTGTPYELDLQMIRPDGSTRWITDRGEALRDATGQIAMLRGTAQDITERKQAEDALRTSEEKFRSVFRDAGVGMVIVSLEGHFLAANDAFCQCLGYTEEELLQKTVQSVTAEEDWPSFSQRLREAIEHGTGLQRVEKHCVHKSGRIVTTESSASLIRGPSGEPRYFVGEVLDITERKLAAEALSSVSRRLIEAHEEERRRIARELHDDINQRMALLATNLERVKQALPASDAQARDIVEASRRVSDLASDIQSLSHRLHSSKLEYLGLAAACAGFCREMSEPQNIEIDFQSKAIPKDLPKGISLCLFRILQEALLNAVKHSGTQQFEVSLTNVSNEIELTVHDSGIGFDPEKTMSGSGLGLASMRERLNLVGGKLSIDSHLQRGTTIRARVPLSPRTKSAKAGE